MKARPEARFLPRLARLANRNQAHILGLRILHPVIADDREKIAPASADALVVYSNSLLGIGALEEAQSHLARVRNHSESCLIQAFIHFAKWEYDRAVPFLVKYIRSGMTPDYQKLVGSVNLLAALIALGRLDEARGTLETLKPSLQSAGAQILYGNTLELESQIAIQEERFEDASRILGAAEEALQAQPGRYLLYVRKWKAVVGLAADPASQAARGDLLRVRSDAAELRNWETIRDCDFHLARLTGQKDLLHRILLGTPYRGFRERVKDLYGLEAPGELRLEYCPGDVARAPEQLGLEFDRMRWGPFFNPTSWPLIQLMARDIYRPPRVGVVFSALYPGEYFDPFHSPQRVRNSVFRFNQWAKDAGVRFRIANRHGDYFLEGPRGLGVACTARARPLRDWEAALRILRKANGPRSFTAATLASELGVTSRTARSLIAEGVEKRKVVRIGCGRGTRYILASGRRRKAAG